MWHQMFDSSELCLADIRLFVLLINLFPDVVVRTRRAEEGTLQHEKHYLSCHRVTSLGDSVSGCVFCRY